MRPVGVLGPTLQPPGRAAFSLSQDRSPLEPCASWKQAPWPLSHSACPPEGLTPLRSAVGCDEVRVARRRWVPGLSAARVYMEPGLSHFGQLGSKPSLQG